MSDTVAPVSPAQAVETPVPVPVQVTPAQVWSAAVQNIVIALCVTVAYFYGKVSQELWIGALAYVGGVDLLGRSKLTRSSAVTVGATGALSLIAKIPHVGTFLVAILTALGLASCSSILPEFGKALDATTTAYVKAEKVRTTATAIAVLMCADVAPESDADQLCEAVEDAAQDALEKSQEANDLLRVVRADYRELNDAAKDDDTDGGVP